MVAVIALPMSAYGQNPAFQADAVLVNADGSNQRIWVVAATASSIRYRETEVSAATKDLKLAGGTSVFLFEPTDYSAALDLFQARKYKQAMAGFVTLKNRYKPVESLPGNHSTLAAFYEMECLRKLGDLERLAAAVNAFSKDPLVREHHLRQLDLYILWEAARTEAWPRLEILAQERADIPMPGYQRAQVGYCHGLALEGLDRPLEALGAYNIALTADTGASEVIARQAALRILAIHKADPEVQEAIGRWGTPDESKGSAGFFRLMEAAAVAHLFELTLGADTPLPDEFKEFLKFRPAG